MKSQPAQPVESPIEIVLRGPIDSAARQRLHAALARLVKGSPRTPLFVRGSLTLHENPSVERPAVASATIDLGHRVVHATSQRVESQKRAIGSSAACDARSMNCRDVERPEI